MTVTEWADRYRMLPEESSPYPGRWETARTPYLKEVMDCLSPMHPCYRVTVKKGAQLGFSDAGINFLMAVADRFGGPAMLVQPTVDLGKAFNREKLEPAIRVTPRVRAKVRAIRSRSEQGSTTLFKKFPGGFLIITGANSSAGLQMRSIKYLMKDELTEWPLDVDNRGDPSEQSETRTDAYTEVRKIYQPSTPGTQGLCRISAAYEESDQRQYFVPCPHCGHAQVLDWERLRYRTEPPFETTYECERCDAQIGHAAKRQMLTDGNWIAQSPGPGRQPGFHISQLYSPFKSWDELVEKWLKAQGDPRKEKEFTQQVLGECWRDEGEAPQWQALVDRREDYPLLTIPPGGLLLTLGVDLGKDHFIYEVVAWGIGKTSWSIDYGKISVGDTADLNNWAGLDEVYNREYPDCHGQMRGLDMTGVDSGYNTHAVYQWTRSRPRTMALDGRDGANHPPLKIAKKVDINYQGKTIRKGAKMWPVGTWTLKSEFYANLRKVPEEETPEQWPLGACHFSLAHSQEFFEEATNEIFTTYIVRDREVRRWKKIGPNHFHDTRIYGMAALEHLGVSRWTFDDWQRLAQARDAPEEGAQRDLALLWNRTVPDGTKMPTAGKTDETDDETPTPARRKVRGTGGVRVRGEGRTRQR